MDDHDHDDVAVDDNDDDGTTEEGGDDDEDDQGGGGGEEEGAAAAAAGENNDDDDDDAEGGGEANNRSNEPVLLIHAVSNLDSLYGLREIGREALCWQLSSAKPGNGVEQIRDQSTDTYWQSDGVSQPHWIQVHFARRVAISHVCLYLDYNLDESYTPKSLSVQVGMTTQDLSPAIYPVNTVIEFNEPVGWCIIPLTAPPDPLDDCEEEDPLLASTTTTLEQQQQQPSSTSSRRRVVRTHLIQISMVSMHQNGRDTHIRQVQLYGPRTATMIPTSYPKEPTTTSSDDPNNIDTSDMKRRHHLDEEFSTVAMSQFSVIR